MATSCPEIVTQLVQAGADINAMVDWTLANPQSWDQMLDQVTALMHASSDKWIFGSVESKPDGELDKSSLLARVATRITRRTDYIKCLLDHGAALEETSTLGYTPFLYACLLACEDAITPLVAAGCNVQATCGV